jgi:hypothetical protein
MYLVYMQYNVPSLQPTVCGVAPTAEAAQKYIDEQMEGKQYNGLGCYTYKEVPVIGEIGNFSDGYHTFNELYEHRCVLFSVICNQNHEAAWKSKLHHDGTMYDGMFIIGLNISVGQVSYHYDLKYWDLFKVDELEKAPEWDGHTPGDVLERMKNFLI